MTAAPALLVIPAAPRAVFLSYAREDTDAARRIAEALRSHGVEVWFDQSELRGGDLWDAKIRSQIKTCTLFMPIISANTHGRHEGYFRLEWKLASERTHLLREGVPFIVPIVVDDSDDDPGAVPEPFLRVQWTWLPGALPTPEFVEQLKRLLEAPARAEAPRSTAPGLRTRDTAGPIGTRPPVAAPPPAAPATGRSMRIVTAVVITAVIAAAGWWWGFRARGGPTAPEKSIAVLAFDNLSGEKDNEFFSDGISEELLNVLAQVPGLRVSARTSAFSFKGKRVPVPEIGQKLSVAYVVEGSVQRSGGRVKITAQLISTADGFHLWSETYTRELKDIFAVQDEIAREIARNLQLKLDPRTRPVRTVNPEAHELVLVARHHWFLRTLKDFDTAEAALAKAIAIDPNFAQAHSGMADVCALRAAYKLLDGAREADVESDVRRAQDEAKRAIQLDASLADPHIAIAYVFMIQGRLDESEQLFARGLALNPNYAVAHSWRANLRASQGRLSEALVGYQKSHELDPLWKVNLGTYAATLGFVGRHQEALALTDRVQAMQADEFFPPGIATRAAALLALGRKSEAITVARSILRRPTASPRWYADALALWILVQAGQGADAARLAEALLKTLPPQSSQRGFILTALGRFDEALPFLEETAPRLHHRLYWDPMWDPYRDDPRFKQLLKHLECDDEYAVARKTLAQMVSPSAKSAAGTTPKQNP